MGKCSCMLSADMTQAYMQRMRGLSLGCHKWARNTCNKYMPCDTVWKIYITFHVHIKYIPYFPSTHKKICNSCIGLCVSVCEQCTCEPHARRTYGQTRACSLPPMCITSAQVHMQPWSESRRQWTNSWRYTANLGLGFVVPEVREWHL